MYNKINRMNHFQCVAEFHNTYGHPIENKELINFDEERVFFRISLMKEELKKLMDARDNNNLIEMADALCDLLYVTYGTAHSLGIDIIKVLSELKLSIETPDDLAVKVNRNIIQENPDMIHNGICDVSNMLEQFILESKRNNFGVMKTFLAFLIYSIYSYGHKIGFNMDRMFREVHSSNMTKVCSNIEDVEETIKRYKEEGRYDEPSFRVKNNYYVIYDAKTSKILKNYKWVKPDIEQYM